MRPAHVRTFSTFQTRWLSDGTACSGVFRTESRTLRWLYLEWQTFWIAAWMRHQVTLFYIMHAGRTGYWLQQSCPERSKSIGHRWCFPSLGYFIYLALVLHVAIVGMLRSCGLPTWIITLSSRSGSHKPTASMLDFSELRFLSVNERESSQFASAIFVWFVRNATRCQIVGIWCLFHFHLLSVGLSFTPI